MAVAADLPWTSIGERTNRHWIISLVKPNIFHFYYLYSIQPAKKGSLKNMV